MAWKGLLTALSHEALKSTLSFTACAYGSTEGPSLKIGPV
eukprot:CAMPEP_0183380602 /NCGR_PEP_ID=MMETSP0164_2-20130417/126016_1 /TAXON_ID=221442 /ORGANISM="Coccolithus pelagicus ssp braarudi, Strain PLY182g" /LENGTH=39 /DNA_ID= /DNA_START= /DNA_END= /DNA_ORIENTATION=